MTFARLGASLFGLALLAGAFAGGCEAIVSNDVPAYTCSMTPYVNAGVGTCPKGEYCKGSGCTICEDRDICDGYDNDCDGKIDNGPYSDHDSDGYTFCGRVDAQSGTLVDVDCVDDDPNVHPGATEICNGKDDNCDGIIDNPDLVCPPSQTCVPKSGQCIATSQACSPANCPPPMVCDPATQKCVQPDQDAGSACSGDKACATGICGDPSELGPGKGPVCTKPCCTSSDCDRGYVCFGAGTGGNYCLDATSVARPAPGNGGPGASCVAATDCRSGVCTTGKCEDTCCLDVNCTNGTTCAVTTFAGQGTLACVNSGTTDPNQVCTQDSDCKSGFCAGYTDGINTYRRCATPCCSSRGCGTFSVDTGFGTITTQLVCYDDAPKSLTGISVPVCDEPKQGKGNGNVGDPCQSNGNCFSDRCGSFGTPAVKLCTDVCCLDADCGKAGWGCRPVREGSGTYLRCVPLQ